MQTLYQHCWESRKLRNCEVKLPCLFSDIYIPDVRACVCVCVSVCESSYRSGSLGNGLGFLQNGQITKQKMLLACTQATQTPIQLSWCFFGRTKSGGLYVPTALIRVVTNKHVCCISTRVCSYLLSPHPPFVASHFGMSIFHNFLVDIEKSACLRFGSISEFTLLHFSPHYFLVTSLNSDLWFPTCRSTIPLCTLCDLFCICFLLNRKQIMNIFF